MCRAADPDVIEFVPLETATPTYAACSDGIHPRVMLRGTGELLRFRGTSMPMAFRSFVPVLLVALVGFAWSPESRALPCGSSDYPFAFTDVAGVGDAFCPGIMEAYVLGVTRGTTATTFSPNDGVTRLQMTTFLKRSIDQTLKRSSRRGALGQWWTPKTAEALLRVDLQGGGTPTSCKSDGDLVWVTNQQFLTSVSVQTGQVLAQVDVGSWSSVAVAYGSVYVAADPDSPGGGLARVRPQVEAPYHFISPPAVVSYNPNRIAFDGDRLWTANYADGSIALIPLLEGALNGTGTVISGFTLPIDVVFDGTNMWVVEANGANRLRKLDAAGAILQTVPVGSNPGYATYDGQNLWVPNHYDHSISVVQAATGTVVATIATDASNRLSAPLTAAFDGERILVTNLGNDSVTLFRAADLSLIGNVQLPDSSFPWGACSDGVNFWVTLAGTNRLLRL